MKKKRHIRRLLLLVPFHLSVFNRWFLSLSFLPHLICVLFLNLTKLVTISLSVGNVDVKRKIMTAILRETVMSETGTNDNEPEILLL